MRRYVKPGAKIKIVPQCRALELYDFLNVEDIYTVQRSSGIVIKIIEDAWVTLFAFEVEIQ